MNTKRKQVRAKTSVRIPNSIAKLGTGWATEKQADLVFYALSLFEESHGAPVEIPIDLAIRSVSFSKHTRAAFGEFVEKTAKAAESWGVFSELSVDGGLFKAALSSQYAGLFENIATEYTPLDYGEFLSIKGRYSKSLYVLLKKWASKGRTPWLDIDVFRDVFGVPCTFQVKKLSERCIKEPVEQLSAYFDGLKVEKEFCGRRLSGVRFVFSSEARSSQAYRYVAKQTFAKYGGKSTPWDVSVEFSRLLKKASLSRRRLEDNKEWAVEVCGGESSRLAVNFALDSARKLEDWLHGRFECENPSGLFTGQTMANTFGPYAGYFSGEPLRKIPKDVRSCIGNPLGDFPELFRRHYYEMLI